VNAAPRPSTPSADLGFVEDYAAAVERFAVAVGWADLRSSVAACPGWSVYDLVVHLGNIHAWAATILETGEIAAEHNDEPRSSKPRSVSEWYFAKAEDLYQVLRQTPPEKPCWNFVFGSGVAGFWQRRQLHETTVHQVDLDVAANRDTEISPTIAADGIDELLTVMLPRMAHKGYPSALAAPLQLTASDTGDRWVLTTPAGPESGPPQVSRPETVAEDVEDRVAAPAAVLYRALWHRRIDPAALRVSGDEPRVRAFLDSRLTV
jgi:uncharacterized protein (TIGR03083 family)